MRTAFAIVLLACGLTSAGAQTPEEQYAAALKVLKSYCDNVCGIGIGKDPAKAKALDALRDATKDWTVAFLNAHPQISDKRLAAALLRPRDKDGIAPVAVTRLAPDVLVFSAHWGMTGDVFIAARRGDTWSIAWDIRNAPADAFPALKAWRTDHTGCHTEDGHDGKFDCGPLWGRVFALKPDGQGRARFAVDAIYAQGGGFTVTSQISFWRWNGTTAEPLLAENYRHEEDAVVRGRNTANTVVVRVKGPYRSFGGCGACTGRQADWTFRILPDRIEDGGKTLLHPESDYIDAVYARMQAHQAVSDAGSPEAIALMGANLPNRGDLVTRKTLLGARVCLFSANFEPHFLRFDVVRHKNSFFIAGARRLSGEDFARSCHQPKEE